MQPPRALLRGACFLALAIAPGACDAGDDAGQAGEAKDATVQSLPAAAQTLVDSGNTAYRGGQFEAALSHFRGALEEAPGHPVPLFGVYLASTALGDSTLADSVATILREEAPWLLGMTQHPEGGATPDPHAEMDMTADPHAGMLMVPVSDSQADTSR